MLVAGVQVQGQTAQLLQLQGVAGGRGLSRSPAGAASSGAGAAATSAAGGACAWSSAGASAEASSALASAAAGFAGAAGARALMRPSAMMSVSCSTCTEWASVACILLGQTSVRVPHGEYDGDPAIPSSPEPIEHGCMQ